MAKITTEDYTRTYTSYSGCDIVCSFGSNAVGSLTAITFSVSREKAPVFTMGSAEPRSFSRGKRAIAGTLVFSVFDRDALVHGLKEHNERHPMHRLGGDISTKIITIDEWDSQMTDLLNKGAEVSNGTSVEDAEKRTNAASIIATPRYSDEIMPFDITISFANEYGQKSAIVIYGVEILNEGQGFGTETMVTEKACTFVARSLETMKAVV